MHTTVPPPKATPLATRARCLCSQLQWVYPEAQAAFQYAVDIWASLLTSEVNIVVDATWEDIPGNTLGLRGYQLLVQLLWRAAGRLLPFSLGQ